MLHSVRIPGCRRSRGMLGEPIPMYCTAEGRAYLSALPESEASGILRRSTCRPITSRTLVDKVEILAEVVLARRAGYACNAEEYRRGELTIAAPIMTQGRSVGTLSVSVSTSGWTLADLKNKVAPELVATAGLLSNELRAAA
jgi:IclR family transcriptional regulator, pca regulon regulatory protein